MTYCFKQLHLQRCNVRKKLQKKQHRHIGTIPSLLRGLYHFNLTNENLDAHDPEPSEHYTQNEPNCLHEAGRDICKYKLNRAEGSSRVVTFYKLLSVAWLTTPHKAFSLIQQSSKQPGKKISFKEI